MVRLGAFGWLVLGTALACMALTQADARSRRRSSQGTIDSGRVPELNVRQSCLDAQKFSTGDNQNLAFKGCMQDEDSAKSDLQKKWSQFKAKDKSNCVEQSRFPSPSYVEVLTCLEMSSDAMRNTPRNGQPLPQIGGPVAPGLSNPTPDPTLKPNPDLTNPSPAPSSPSLKDKP